MSFWRRMFGREREEKASATGQAVAYWTTGQAVYTPRNYEAFAREAYARNAIAYRCIAMIAQAAAGVPMFARRTGATRAAIDAHPVLDLLARPNPREPGAAMLERFFSFYLIAGNGYLERVGPAPTRPPAELWALRPDRMRVVPGPDALPIRYEYEANGITARFEVDRVTGRSPIMHMSSFNPVDDFYGQSAIDPASYAIDRHNAGGAHNTATLQNGATPSGAMVFKHATHEGRLIMAPEEAIKAAETRIAERYSGPMNAGKPMVFGGNVEWVTFGMDMEKLQLNESMLTAAQEICAAFGVPIALFLPGQSTYNNMREAKLGFYEETVIPLAERGRDHLNAWLLPQYDDRTVLELDLDRIEALALRRETQQANVLKLYQGGIITRDEAREALDYDRLDEGIRERVDAPVLAQLVTAVREEALPMEALWRYARAVGLLPETMTDDALLALLGRVVDSEEDAIGALGGRGSGAADGDDDGQGEEEAG